MSRKMLVPMMASPLTTPRYWFSAMFGGVAVLRKKPSVLLENQPMSVHLPEVDTPLKGYGVIVPSGPCAFSDADSKYRLHHPLLQHHEPHTCLALFGQSEGDNECHSALSSPQADRRLVDGQRAGLGGSSVASSRAGRQLRSRSQRRDAAVADQGHAPFDPDRPHRSQPGPAFARRSGAQSRAHSRRLTGRGETDSGHSAQRQHVGQPPSPPGRRHPTGRGHFSVPAKI